MTNRPLAWRIAASAGAILWLLGAAAPAAQAHPLGNFSVNHYTGFTLRPDRVDVLAVTDTAEIPTLQATTRVDSNGDGTQSATERAAWATARCAETAGKLAVTTPGRLNWAVGSATYAEQPGQAGLHTSRLECHLRAPLDLTQGPVTLRVDTGADRTRVGWNEITAKGVATHLQHSTVPDTSPTGELRNYPRELLATPRGDTRAEFTAVAGDGASNVGRAASRPDSSDGLTGRVDALSQHLTSLAGAERLTVPVGLLAVLLSVVLGAGHALLPGHGKTVMAAYLAGRRGSTRDAVTVGATVTITHTAGVLVIGLCLTTFSSLAGDTVLNWLGVISGALVTAVGAALLTNATRRSRRSLRTSPSNAGPADAPQTALVGATGPALQAHGSDGHAHAHSRAHDHVPGQPHRHGLFGHHHTHASPAAEAQSFTNRGLVGLGVAGGLVPSPSALVVLLGAIALGRTIFGATLVLAYGLGMAATLTALGLLLVRLGGRAAKLADRPLLARLRRIAPYTTLLTAALVLLVGLGLMIRSLPFIL
ncbi:high frequency lysogenization protein HflD [Streptomyces sp. H10-C2]|uniref:HoxN/HupN/NixA family nickel/cobalt transporter n=1 Tax=unclassified Streptomyces TaxID=2593676 RepID=UPI0024B8EFE5|nr:MULTISPECIES: high frequency lysogenization protein HflD [unclassified Streptomyces]MDJ0347424.1 high frequency lysogenization protein HflD [Streptomyces sp. PH10-H1]MDJ0375666.1 high frequency lysogenization protein HflD [Streptomyces sp. H10-C2]